MSEKLTQEEALKAYYDGKLTAEACFQFIRLPAK